MKKDSFTLILLIAFAICMLSLYSRTNESNIQKNNHAGFQDKPESGLQQKNQLSRALSLRVLQKQLQTCVSDRKCSKILLELGRLTKIERYILDETSEDLILVGEADPSLPPLYTEDFVVALRNAWLRYAKKKGRTYYYSGPGCSIDPRSRIMKKLNKIWNDISSGSSDEMEKEIRDQWCQTCEKPQNVRVLGIPFNTHFSKVMVDADYFMKRLVDGSVSLGIEGFDSLTDLEIKKIEKDLEQNKQPSVRRLSMNRFWFYPGENTYTYDNGTIRIDKCKVILLTEKENLSWWNKLAAKKEVDLLAEQFAKDFTRFYRDIALKKSIYLELEALFRFVSLAKIMKERNIDKYINIDYLLDRFPVSKVELDSILPGIPHFKLLEYKNYNFQFATCGGVLMNIEFKPEDSIKDRNGELIQLKKAVLKSRPSSQALLWSIHSLYN